MNSPIENLKIDSAGRVLRALREEQGFSLPEFAERIGWDKGRLSKVENNHLAVSLTTIEAIARGLGMLPESIALRCLAVRFPGLAESKPGMLLAQLVSTIEENA
jgi:transcriptional regulator with XRE-family HTH domain